MDETKTGNIHEFTVSELSFALKRTIEDTYGYVRVRGEIGRVSRPGSGHVYFDLKDEKAVLNGVIWRGTVSRLKVAPEQGLEVVCTGKLTTFPGQSRYQIVVERMEPAGVGALMALLEERRRKLAAEGLFDEARKKPLPYLPRVIGVVTSPSGAVIRDILHRLNDRFPRPVLIWPVLVQGDKAAEQIAAGIRGFNALSVEGAVPRPDLIIVARGGGSIEDLWPFNEEMVVRAAHDSAIPLISAVGHETDTTLIDFAADRRAPTPTAAAEMAVPVRAELVAGVRDLDTRLGRALDRRLREWSRHVESLGRALPRLDDLLALPGQRLDAAAERLRGALRLSVEGRASRLALVARLSARPLMVRLARMNERLGELETRGRTALGRGVAQRRTVLEAQGRALAARSPGRALERAEERLEAAAVRLIRSARRQCDNQARRLDGASKLLNSYSYTNVLERGFVLVHQADGRLVRRAAETRPGQGVTLHFADGRRPAVIGPSGEDGSAPGAKGAKRPTKRIVKKTARDPQGRLF